MKLIKTLAAVSLLATPATVMAHDQGVTDTEILLGEVEPLTGPPALLGVAHNLGVRLALAEVNANGGIGGRQVKLVAEDDGYVTSRTIQSVRKLIGVNKVFALTALSGSGQALAAMPVVKRSGIPTMVPIGPLPPLYEPPNDNIFVVGQSYTEGMRQLAEHLAKEYPGKKWGIILQDDDYGKSLGEGIEQAKKAVDINVVYETKYARGQKDFASEMLRVKDAGVEVLIAGGIISENIAMVKEAEKVGIDPVIATFWPGRVPEVLKAIGPASDGIYGVDYVVPMQSEAGKAFLELAAKYLSGDDVKRVNRYTMTGYSSTVTLLAAMKGCADDLTWTCTIDKLQTNPPVDTGVMSPIGFGADNRFSNSKVTIMRANYATLSFVPVE
ncbi:ABC transporter substrate-binding protein [Rhodobacteraceae bacterium D3-12]|nr:ABC transporter substrate-binding protein [Rhodobacteraceae bacterium D3-12]